MLLLLSGEGVTDIGSCQIETLFCCDEHYQAGPMAIIVDRLTAEKMGYSHLDSALAYFIHRSQLSQFAKNNPQKKRLHLPNKTVKKETREYFLHANALAQLAQQLANEKKDKVIAVYFRDADGTRSSAPTLWQDKMDAIECGFSSAGFALGVAMMPKPKSEAWLLCALKHQYQNCTALENASGNDNSPNSLKKQLAIACGKLATDAVSAQEQIDIVQKLKLAQIDMPSFLYFKQQLFSKI